MIYDYANACCPVLHKGGFFSLIIAGHFNALTYNLKFTLRFFLLLLKVQLHFIGN